MPAAVSSQTLPVPTAAFFQTFPVSPAAPDRFLSVPASTFFAVPATTRHRATATDLLAAAVGAVPGGTSRPGQEAMAKAIERAVQDREHLLVQAGTGTGKSLAYLTPALLVDGPVVVSTATLALQNQLIEHDLPRLAEAVEPVLGRRPTFAVLKGRHHYLCVAKMEHADEEEPTDTLFDDVPRSGKWLGERGRLGKQIQRLQEWAEKTATGDRDELDPASTTPPGARSRCRPGIASGRRSARTAPSASPRRPAPGPGKRTS